MRGIKCGSIGDGVSIGGLVKNSTNVLLFASGEGVVRVKYFERNILRDPT